MVAPARQRVVELVVRRQGGDGVLLGLYALALYLFRHEIKTLYDTVRQIIREGAGALKRRAANTHHEGDAT